MFDAEDQTAEAEPALSLEDEIGAALDAAPDDVGEDQGRARDAAGRFAASETAKDGAPGQIAPIEGPKPPVWYKPELGDWGQVPETMRAAILDRERAISNELERRAAAMRPWESVAERVAPYVPQLQAQGVAPEQFLGNLVAAHDALTRDPVAALQWIAESYGVDLSALAGGYEEQAPEDPRLTAMAQRLEQLQGQVQHFGSAWQQQQQAAQQQQQAVLQSEISAFAKDKSDFDTLRPLMATFLQGGQAQTMAEAYEQARWAHPETRQRILEEQRKADATKAQRARAAGSTLRGAPVNGAVTRGPELSLEEEIAALIDAA